MVNNIDGFLSESKRTASGGVYRGRFLCPGVQWTDTPGGVLATFTITAEEIADAAANNLLWTDQDVQRGIQPSIQPLPERELSLSSGYPDPRKYIFDVEKADEITEKLLRRDKLFLNPLVWNLRPSYFQAYWNEEQKEIYLYDGRIYLPDSHHRHQAIVKAASIWRSVRRDYPRFDGSEQFKIELYFLDKEDEGNYFFAKNLQSKPTAKSKSYDLTTQDDLSLLAKRVIEKSSLLRKNVNRVTDRLASNNPHVMTLSTLREMMRTFAANDHIDATEMEGLSEVAAEFYDMLGSARSELGHLNIHDRQQVRRQSLADSAVMMHGYAALMKEYNADLGARGSSVARTLWTMRIAKLKPDTLYSYNDWTGDFFDKRNPLWSHTGIIKPNRTASGMTIVNTGATRAEAGRILRQLISVSSEQRDIQFLAML